MVIYPPNTNPIEKRVKGSRQVAERTAHSTIGTWLDLHQTHGRKIQTETLPKIVTCGPMRKCNTSGYLSVTVATISPSIL
jgi:hypothetical protein